MSNPVSLNLREGRGDDLPTAELGGLTALRALHLGAAQSMHPTSRVFRPETISLPCYPSLRAAAEISKRLLLMTARMSKGSAASAPSLGPFDESCSTVCTALRGLGLSALLRSCVVGPDRPCWLETATQASVMRVAVGPGRRPTGPTADCARAWASPLAVLGGDPTAPPPCTSVAPPGGRAGGQGDGRPFAARGGWSCSGERHDAAALPRRGPH